MKRLPVVLSALLLLFSSGFTQAQQRTTASSSNPKSDGNVIDAISGSGKKDYVALWLTGSSLGDSKIFQSSGGQIGIGTTTPAATLDVKGTVNAATSFNLGGSPFSFGTFAKLNAFGGFSGNSTMTGADNTAAGAYALANNTTGFENTAVGNGALVVT